MKSILKNIISSLGNFLFFYKKKEIKREEIRKILIISLYFRGDVLFNTPAVSMLKRIFPDAEIDVLVKSRSEEVLKGNPDINKIIVFDHIKTADYNDNTGIGLSKKLTLLKNLRKENYDLCVDLTGKYSTGLITMIGKFSYSFGLNYNGFGFCYSKFVNIDTQNSKGHLTDKYLNVVKEGLAIKEAEWNGLNSDFNNKCVIRISETEMISAEHQIKSLNINRDEPLICIQVTAGWKAKEWSEKNYSDLIGNLIASDHSFLLIGSDKDKEINFRILDSVSPGLRKYYLSLPLKVNAAIVSLSDIFIGSDSIGLHLAGAVNTPSIGLFGPTNPSFSNPEGEIHKVIYKKLTCSASDTDQYCTRNAGKTCLSVDCMKNINTDEVMKNVEYLLNQNFIQKRITV